MKIIALTFGGEDAASTHYRVLQYREFLKAEGIDFDWHPATDFTFYDQLAEADCVILQKALLPRRRIDKIRAHSRRLVYDLDDALWHRPENDYRWWTRQKQLWRLGHIARTSDRCLCANRVLTGKLDSLGAVDTQVIPMAIDATEWKAESSSANRRNSPLTVGWSGSPKNLTYLENFLPAWLEVQRSHPEVHWIIHCGRKPGLKGLDFEHVPYIPGQEPAVVSRFDIGLLPLPSDDFSQGKSPIKGLQYLSTGAAVVATPAEATRELLPLPGLARWARSDEEWVLALSEFIKNSSLRHDAQTAGLEFFHQYHRTEAVYRQWIEAVLQ